MSLIKFKRRPVGNQTTQYFSDRDNFLDNSRKARKYAALNFWNGKRSEPALNIKENDGNFEIELAAPGFTKKDLEVTIEDGCPISKRKAKITISDFPDTDTGKYHNYFSSFSLLCSPSKLDSANLVLNDLCHISQGKTEGMTNIIFAHKPFC